jgi:hypothetical protein
MPDRTTILATRPPASSEHFNNYARKASAFILPGDPIDVNDLKEDWVLVSLIFFHMIDPQSPSSCLNRSGGALQNGAWCDDRLQITPIYHHLEAIVRMTVVQGLSYQSIYFIFRD